MTAQEKLIAFLRECGFTLKQDLDTYKTAKQYRVTTGGVYETTVTIAPGLLGYTGFYSVFSFDKYGALVGHGALE